MRSRLVLFAPLALLALLGAPASAATLPADLPGTWHADGPGGREQAIDALVHEMSFFKRPIARRRLKNATEPCGELTFRVEGGEVVSRCDDRPPAADAPGGEPSAYTDSDGDELQVQYEVDDDRLVQTFIRDEERRVNTYTVDGNTLTLEVRVESPRLPRALTYTRTFSRAGQAPAS